MCLYTTGFLHFVIFGWEQEWNCPIICFNFVFSLFLHLKQHILIFTKIHNLFYWRFFSNTAFKETKELEKWFFMHGCNFPRENRILQLNEPFHQYQPFCPVWESLRSFLLPKCPVPLPLTSCVPCCCFLLLRFISWSLIKVSDTNC